MPTRIYPIRPIRYAQRGGGDVSYGGELSGGEKFGTTLVDAINAAKRGAAQQALQKRMDPIANQLINTAQPPRAALVAPGVNPQTNAPNVINPAVTNVAGSEPATGGVEELNARAQMAQLAGQLQAPELARDRAARALAGRGGVQPQAGSLGGWEGYQGGGGKQPGTTRTKAGQEEPAGPLGTTPLTSFKQLQTHINEMYGNGTYEHIVNNMDSGDTTTNPGYVTFTDPDGKKSVKIPTNDFATYQKQFNSLRQGQGLSPVYGKGQDKTMGTTPDNPIDVANDLDAAATPPGSYVRTPDGQIKRKPTQ